MIRRRDVLHLSAATVLVSTVLEACAPPAPAPNPTSASAAAGGPLPTYIAHTNTPKPDFHANDPRITDGFINYPKSPTKSWTAGPPSNGGTVNVLVPAYYPVPTPHDQNGTWKEVEKALNASINMTIVPGADYPTRLQTVMAGSDLPDTIHVIGTVDNLISTQFVQSQCSDLTPFLGGDAARDYPNLAAIPSYAFKGSGAIFENHLYGIPIQRYLPAFWFFRNTDIWDTEIGSGAVPKDAEDFKKILQQLNHPQQERWAIGNFGTTPSSQNMYGLVGFLEMFGAPNMWELDASGKLVRDRETEQYKAAVGYMRDLIGSGVYPPDIQTTASATAARAAFIAGRFVVSTEAFGNGWNDFWRRGLQQNPPRHYTIVAPFSATAGTPARHFLTGGTVAYNLIKKSSADRAKEILRIMDYLAAPFGTTEDVLLTYGLRDQDYSVDADGNPSPTQPGLMNASYVPWQYIAHRPYVWYQADLPGYAKAAFDVEQTLVGVGVSNPTQGLHSATQARQGVAADQTFFDGVADILFNRRPFSDYDTLVADWRKSVGDTIRQEFLSQITR